MEKLIQSDIGFQANLYSADNPTRRWLHTDRRDWIFSAIDRYSSPYKQTRALEVGVGCGIFTQKLSNAGCEILAIDLNVDFLTAVAPLPGVSAMEGDAAKMNVSGYDLAVCSEVLEHVPPSDSLSVLLNLQRAILPHGYLILTMPQGLSSMELFARMLRFPPVLWLARLMYGTVDELGHINLLTRNNLKKQIHAAGMEIVEEARLGLYVPVLAELFGNTGQKIAKSMSHLFNKTPFLNHLLWTQCYVLRKST